MIFTFSSLRKPKLNGLNGMACKEKWMDGKKIVLCSNTDKFHEYSIKQRYYSKTPSD